MVDIKNKVIRIAKIEMDNGRYKIRSSDGELYSFFQFKSGTKIPTQAYEHFTMNNHGEQFTQEDLATIGYTEIVKPDNQGANRIYKNIISMFPSDGVPEAQTVSAAPSQPSPVYVSTDVESKEAYGRRLAIHGMANGLLAGGHKIEEVKSNLPQLFDLENSIEKLLSSRKEEDKIIGKIPF